MNRLMVTAEEEVILLERMFRPNTPISAEMPVFNRAERELAEPIGLRIVEAHAVPAQVRPLADALNQQTLAYLRLRWEIARGLVIACMLLLAATSMAAFDRATCLTVLLGALAFACIPLYLMATPSGPEVR